MKIEILIFICAFDIGSSLKDDWIIYLNSQIKKEIQPRQVTFMVHNMSTLDILYKNKELHQTFDSIPSVTIDLKKIKYSNDQRPLNMPVIHPSDSTLNIILQNQDEFEDYVKNFREVLRLFVDLKINTKKPKCLIISLNDEGVDSDKSLKKMIMQAWTMNIAHFTIMEVRPDDYTTVMFYNPSLKEVQRKRIDVKPKLFPPKKSGKNEL